MKHLPLLLALVATLTIPAAAQQRTTLHAGETYDSQTAHRIKTCPVCGKGYYPWDWRFLPCAKQQQTSQQSPASGSPAPVPAASAAGSSPAATRQPVARPAAVRDTARVPSASPRVTPPPSSTTPKPNVSRRNRQGNPVRTTGYDYGQGDTLYYHGARVNPDPEPGPAYDKYKAIEAHRQRNADRNARARAKDHEAQHQRNVERNARAREQARKRQARQAKKASKPKAK